MAVAISVQNVSKRYRLGEDNRVQLLRDFHRWWTTPKKTSEFSLPAEQTPEEGDFWALNNISFEIEKGETVGIIGANGAGKSTLLKLLSRITIPTEGRIRLRGRVGSLLEVGSGFHRELSGRDNIYLNGAILGMNRSEIRKKFDEIVQFAELEQFIDTPVKRYSSGMYMRLAFSISAALQPEILILDEVMAVGDTAFKLKCFARIEELVKSGRTILFVAHDSASILRFCKRVIWLEKGRIRFDGDAEEGCEEYRKGQLQKGSLTESKEQIKLLAEGVYTSFKSTEHTGSGEYRINKFIIRNQMGEPSGTVRCGDPCSLSIFYQKNSELAAPFEKGFALLAIDDEQGRRMLGLRSDFVGLDIGNMKDQGELVCRIPRVPLLPGIYKLSFMISINEQVVERIISGALLQVLDGDFYKSKILPERRTTPVCVDFSWEKKVG
jgi:lipopolysaccharide transport system ATP-binding protein